MVRRPQIPAVPPVEYPELASTFQAIRQNVDLLWKELETKAPVYGEWSHTVVLPSGTGDGNYDAWIDTDSKRMITTIITKSASGTANLELRVNGVVQVGDVVNAVSSTKLTTNPAKDNILYAGQTLTINISSASSLGRTVVTIKGVTLP